MCFFNCSNRFVKSSKSTSSPPAESMPIELAGTLGKPGTSGRVGNPNSSLGVGAVAVGPAGGRLGVLGTVIIQKSVWLFQVLLVHSAW